MNIVLWTVAGLLGTGFLSAGVALVFLGREKYRALGANQHWVDDFGDPHLKAIGTVKIIGAVGLLAPGAVGVATVLTPLAACGMALFMAGAGTTRFRRSEWGFMLGDLVFLSALAFLAWGRFDLEPF